MRRGRRRGGGEERRRSKEERISLYLSHPVDGSVFDSVALGVPSALSPPSPSSLSGYLLVLVAPHHPPQSGHKEESPEGLRMS